LGSVYGRMLKWEIEELDFLEEQKEKLEREIAEVLQAHAAAVQRLAEVPGLGPGRRSRSSLWWVLPRRVFPSAKSLASWCAQVKR
jgi:transposase